MEIYQVLILTMVRYPSFFLKKYGNDPKFSDRYAWANSADPDQTVPRGVWSGCTLFAIPSASFGLTTVWYSHIVQILEWLQQTFWMSEYLGNLRYVEKICYLLDLFSVSVITSFSSQPYFTSIFEKPLILPVHLLSNFFKRLPMVNIINFLGSISSLPLGDSSGIIFRITLLVLELRDHRILILSAMTYMV